MVPERSNAERCPREGECRTSKIWNGPKGRSALAAAICVAFVIPHPAAAVITNTLSLLSTKMSAKSDDLPLSTTPTVAFDQLTLVCPQNQVCIIRIEYSAQFFKLSPSGVEALVTINGLPGGILPGSRIDLVSGADGYSTNTFTHWRKGLPPGQYTVSVAFRLNQEGGGVGLRTLTVQMFEQ